MKNLNQQDQKIADYIDKELKRQQQGLELIPSENFVSLAVLEALGSILTNKYSEGYPGKRYYGGTEHVDVIEQMAIDRAKQLFKAEHANVQPLSGAPANIAVYSALLEPGDTLELILHWRLQEKPPRQYTIFAHLLDVNGQVASGFDANEYPTTFWREDGGERLLSYLRLPLDKNLPPGQYQLEIGVYNQPSGQRLPVLDEGEAVADRLLLAPVELRE